MWLLFKFVLNQTPVLDWVWLGKDCKTNIIYIQKTTKWWRGHKPSVTNNIFLSRKDGHMPNIPSSLPKNVTSISMIVVEGLEV